MQDKKYTKCFDSSSDIFISDLYKVQSGNMFLKVFIVFNSRHICCYPDLLAM